MAFTTSKSLLARVQKGDGVSWEEFYKTYTPLIFLCGRDLYLNQNEKEELVQNVMFEIFQKDILAKFDNSSVPENFQYDPAKGRFRHYFRRIARNQALKIIHQRNNDLPIDEIPLPIPSENDWDEIWDKEWASHLLNQAMIELKGKVNSTDYAIFEQYALEKKSARELAEFYERSESAVYVAKHRCIAELKKIIANLDNE